MTRNADTVAVLGLGAMGSALAGALLDASYDVTVWNRTSGRSRELIVRGATDRPAIEDAVTAGDVVIVCLYNHASVHEVLDAHAESLAGRTVINLTTTTPNEARELAGWAAGHGIDYLDGAIMATPEMIGRPQASIFYSGPREVFESRRRLLDAWGSHRYDGEDAGMASLFDLAMLSGMYTMFAGFLHGAAMTASAGISAGEYAERATGFLAAMTSSFASMAATIDGGDYGVSGQSLEWSDLGGIVRASEEQQVNPEPIAMVQSLIQQQIDAGHGADVFDRIYESLTPQRIK